MWRTSSVFDCHTGRSERRRRQGQHRRPDGKSHNFDTDSCVNIRARGYARLSFRRLNSNGGRPSGPQDRFGFSLLITNITSRWVKLTVVGSVFEQFVYTPLSHNFYTDVIFPYSSVFPTGLPAYVRPCMPVIPLVPSYSSTLISSLHRLSAHHWALSASASQPLKSGTLPPALRTCISPDTFRRSVVTWRPSAASRPSSPLNPSPFVPQIQPLLTIVLVYKLYLLT